MKLNDGHLTDILGLPCANSITKTALTIALKTRNTVARRRRLSAEPQFIPCMAGSTLYPNGYRLDDIGPENIMSPASQPNQEQS